MKLQLAAGAPDPAQLRKFFLSLVSAASHEDSRKGLQNYFKFHLWKTNLHPDAHVTSEADTFTMLQLKYRTELSGWITNHESKDRKNVLMSLFDSLPPDDRSYAPPPTLSEGMKLKKDASSEDFAALHMFRQALDLKLKMDSLGFLREHLGDSLRDSCLSTTPSHQP